MKKLNDANTEVLVPLSTCLCLFSYNNDNNNLLEDCAGFEHSRGTAKYGGSKPKCELEIEIVAIEKTKRDRMIVLAMPPLVIEQATVTQLTEKEVIIKASRKSATTIIKIYPKQIVLNKQNATLSCTPQREEGGISKLTILLKRK